MPLIEEADEEEVVPDMHAESLKSIINGDKQITATGNAHKRKRYSDDEDKYKDDEDSDDMTFEEKEINK